jgi:acetyl esterase/lipase
MAPEYFMPIPVNDCYDVVKYLLDNPQEFSADLSRIMLAGDSAGNSLNETIFFNYRITVAS